jgi:hypothetical protein
MEVDEDTNVPFNPVVEDNKIESMEGCSFEENNNNGFLQGEETTP